MVTPASNNIAPRPGSPGVQHRYNNFFSRAPPKRKKREMKAVSSSGLSSWLCIISRPRQSNWKKLFFRASFGNPETCTDGLLRATLAPSLQQQLLVDVINGKCFLKAYSRLFLKNHFSFSSYGRDSCPAICPPPKSNSRRSDGKKKRWRIDTPAKGRHEWFQPLTRPRHITSQKSLLKKRDAEITMLYRRRARNISQGKKGRRHLLQQYVTHGRQNILKLYTSYSSISLSVPPLNSFFFLKKERAGMSCLRCPWKVKKNIRPPTSVTSTIVYTPRRSHHHERKIYKEWMRNKKEK